MTFYCHRCGYFYLHYPSLNIAFCKCPSLATITTNTAACIETPRMPVQLRRIADELEQRKDGR